MNSQNFTTPATRSNTKMKHWNTPQSSKSSAMTKDERRQKRYERKQQKNSDTAVDDPKQSENEPNGSGGDVEYFSKERMQNFMQKNESELLAWVANVNKIYEEKLRKPAPFMTFVFCGMQSTGKSTIMERFLGAPLNIVQEGTGTRCPLDCTCIHDTSCHEPLCDLSGSELPIEKHGEKLSIDTVFERVIDHNKRLDRDDAFSVESLRLIFRSSQVQNMRFVDTPGIIANRSVGKDNREDIKTILRAAMRKPNSYLCVLLEPKEFATNQIIDFLDDTFDGREKWLQNATFLMTKFDKQFDDSRTGSKANNFFKEFLANKCVPFLIATPTLSKPNLPSDELFLKRKELLSNADEFEQKRFEKWIQDHRKFDQEEGGDELLKEEIEKRIGFRKAETYMRATMLEHTANQLPVVLKEIRDELKTLQDQQKILSERMKLTDPGELKALVIGFLVQVQKRISSYLDGDMEVAIKFPDRLQTLYQEIDEEDESEWSQKELNHHTRDEEDWRDLITNMNIPTAIQPDSKFLGGKQVQRAMELFRRVMIESIPDPSFLKDYVANATGYGVGQLNHENWERALVQTVQATMKKLSNPGVNYLIKHVGSIFRSLIALAFEDVKTGGQLSSKYNLIPDTVEKFLHSSFEDRLWLFMVSAAEKTLISLEPMYSIIDPTLPTLAPEIEESHLDVNFIVEQLRFYRVPDEIIDDVHSTYTKGDLNSSKSTFLSKIRNLADMTAKKVKEMTADKMKEMLMNQSDESWAQKRQSFLPEERSPMMTSSEADVVITHAIRYIIALMHFQQPLLKFQISHYLIKGFRNEIEGTFTTTVLDLADWNSLVVRDPEAEMLLKNVEGSISALTSSVKLVQRMQRGY